MAQPPKVPEATSVDGTETFFGIQAGRWKRFAGDLLRHGRNGLNGKDGAPGLPGKDGRDGLPGKDGSPGNVGAPGKPRRIERYTAKTEANGVATFTFAPAFSGAVDIEVIAGWIGEQEIGGAVTAQTSSGCTVQAMVSRGTLALSSGPFQKAGVGVSVTVRAIGD